MFPFEFPFAFDKTFYEQNHIYGRPYTLFSPYIERSNRYKVQLHCHTTESDGTYTPYELLTAYKNEGYHAVAITDHNHLTSNPNVEGILYLPGDEETLATSHILNLGATHDSLFTTEQDILNDIIQSDGISAFAHTWWGAIYNSISFLSGFKNFHLVEIESHAVQPPSDNDYPFGELLSLGFHIWAIGTDDTHSSAQFNKCFVEVLADELSVSAILESIREGNLYIRESGAPQITLTMDGDTVFCESDVEANIVFIGRDNLVLKSQTGTSAGYLIKGWEQFVRARVTNNGYTSWTQPVWIIN
jgi:hypothetical protein